MFQYYSGISHFPYNSFKQQHERLQRDQKIEKFSLRNLFHLGAFSITLGSKAKVNRA